MGSLNQSQKNDMARALQDWDEPEIMNKKEVSER
jgi:hypothetical protein